MKNPVVAVLCISLVLFLLSSLFKFMHWPFVMAFFIGWIVVYITALVLTLKMLFQLDDTELVSRGLWFLFILLGPWWGSFLFLYVHRHDLNADR